MKMLVKTIKDLFLKNKSYIFELEIDSEYRLFVEGLDSEGGSISEDFDIKKIKNIIAEIHKNDNEEYLKNVDYLKLSTPVQTLLKRARDQITIKGILIDVINEVSVVTEFPKELEEYYKILNCQLIDIKSCVIGNKVYDIVCDDEGLFKSEVKTSAINKDGHTMFVGNILIVNFDGYDDIASLTETDIDYLQQYIEVMNVITKTKNGVDIKSYPILTNVSF